MIFVLLIKVVSNIVGRENADRLFIQDVFARSVPWLQFQPKQGIKENKDWTWTTTKWESLYIQSPGHIVILENCKVDV